MMRARCKHFVSGDREAVIVSGDHRAVNALDLSVKFRLVAWALRGPSYIPDSVRLALPRFPRIWNRSINAREFPVKRKSQNVGDFLVSHLFVVVPFHTQAISTRPFSHPFPGRSKLKASDLIMMRMQKRLFLSAIPVLWAGLASVPASAQSSGAAAPIVPNSPATGVSPARKLDLPGLPNAGKISDVLYRGAQPRAEGYQQLKNLSIEVVVDLHNSGSSQEAERQAVEALGMRYISMRASAIHGPSDAQVAEFLTLLRDNPNQRVFVHCNLGADRAGVMVAAFRIAQQQWTPDQAYNEMREFHFHTFLYSMGRYIKYFPQNYAQNPVFAALRPSPPSN
jgi:tyrosine-protein phosphatase SIW14